MILELVLFVFIVFSCLHYLPNQHWVFRTLEFAKIQLTFIQVLSLVLLAFYFNELSSFSLILGTVLLFLLFHNISILLPYTPIYSRESKTHDTFKQNISFLAVNVLQYNEKHHLLIDLVKDLKPDILITIESNQSWEKSLQQIEHLYQNSKKIPQDNTYGMHFYTKLEAESITVNYFVADDLPSIEAHLYCPEGKEFIFFGVHPPPPSPTEEETSKERDGDILALGKKIKTLNATCLVVGDFNNVAWSKSSKLFKKVTQLLDPRIGRGFISTFHAKYLLLRFPIDLVFHSDSIYIQELRSERHINSDHFPIYGEFIINGRLNKQKTDTDKPNEEEKEEVNNMIDKGKAEESNERKT